MASSVDNVENQYDSSDKFKNCTFMQQNYPQQFELLCQKRCYPYAWVNDLKKLDHKGLPPTNALNSPLEQASVADDEYNHAQQVYEHLKCNDLQGLPHDLPKMRCPIVGGRVQHLQEDMHGILQVGPCKLPNISKSGSGRHATANKDQTMAYQWCRCAEHGWAATRGGLCYIGSKRHVKANNMYLTDYNPSH